MPSACVRTTVRELLSEYDDKELDEYYTNLVIEMGEQQFMGRNPYIAASAVAYSFYKGLKKQATIVARYKVSEPGIRKLWGKVKESDTYQIRKETVIKILKEESTKEE